MKKLIYVAVLGLSLLFTGTVEATNRGGFLRNLLQGRQNQRQANVQKVEVQKVFIVDNNNHHRQNNVQRIVIVEQNQKQRQQQKVEKVRVRVRSY